MKPHVLFLLPLLVGCPAHEPTPPRPVVAGAPVAGAAEGTIDLPVGTPLGGFSSRAMYLGADSKKDNRDSAYSTGFVESTGIQTRPAIKVVWLENGDAPVVLIRLDLIYTFDELVSEVARQLGERTGMDLSGSVVITTSHSHNTYGPFSDQFHFYLGGDRYNEEIFQRLALQVTDVAEAAFDARQPAAIGTAWAKDWDPQDRVYRDRRGENDDLAVWDDVEPGMDKDPWLNVLRIDSVAGDPIAMLYTFGIHGTTMGADSSMVSIDSPGHLDLIVQESMPEGTVVMHMQGGAGDASPAGSDSGYARMETVGEEAKGSILDLWENTPTSSEPLTIESASRHLWQGHDQIRVQRDGAVDWYYTPLAEAGEIDDLIYDSNGDILSPIDEFNAPYGAAFCGSDAPLIPAGDIGATVFPYSACMDVELVSAILYGIFELELDSVPLPLPESLKAGTTSILLSSIPTLIPEEGQTQAPMLLSFFPGEPTAMFTEQWRRRAENELGYRMPLLVGYSQDHEGYLLIPEDWLLGGYEPNINVWGPLQAEHMMEGVLHTADALLGNGVHDDPDPIDYYAQTPYLDRPLPTILPDPTPLAGERLTESPEYLWIPEQFSLDLSAPTTVRRVQDHVQIAWQGGDPMVDLPRVTLQRLEDGTWSDVTSASGRPITDTFQDILLAHTPDPLYPVEIEQTHYWWTTWQAVGHVFDRTSLPLGTYRLHIEGQHWAGGDDTWPWTTLDYSLDTDPFELVPADIDLEQVTEGLSAWIQGPSQGYRLIAMEGSSTGPNPLHGTLQVEWGDTTGSLGSEAIEASAPADGKTAIEIDLSGATWVTVSDEAGNIGTLTLTES